jgi:hypothetical protein
LGHLVAGVEAIYNRYHFRDEMRLAFEKLAHLIDTIVNPQPNVVPLHCCYRSHDLRGQCSPL